MIERAVVVGAGAVGRQAAQFLATSGAARSVVLVHRDHERTPPPRDGLAEGVELRRATLADLPDGDVVVIAAPGAGRRAARRLVGRGRPLVFATDDPAEVRHLLALDGAARDAGISMVLGAAMAPGLGCVLAAHLRRGFDRVEEVHVASVGTGGPACARRHHAALTAIALNWESGEWHRRPGGSGRELVWFPEPVGGADCYRAGLADPLLLVPAFPGIRRVTARLEATRRDRMTSWLPMMRRPHPEGLVGAVRVEVRGWVGGRAETRILGSAVRPATAAAAVASTAARWAADGRLSRAGAGGLAEMIGSPGEFLRELRGLGVVVASFEGRDPYAPTGREV